MTSSASSSDSSSSLQLFLDAIHDLASLPLVAIEQQPERVEDFLNRIGGIDVLFGALATPIQDADIRDDISRCFRSVLKSEPGRAALSRYPSLAKALLDGLRHPDEFVRQAASEQLLDLFSGRDVAVRDRLRAVLADGQVFDGVLEAVADSSTSVSETVSRLILSMADADRFFSDSSCCKLRSLCKSDPIVMVRVFDLAARIGNSSPAAFERFRDSGLLDEVLAQVGGDASAGGHDPLLQMSMLTVIGIVSQSKDGLRFLAQIPLGTLLCRFQPGPAVDAYLTCSALNQFDVLMSSSIDHRYYDWIKDADLHVFLTASMESDDETILEAAIGAVATIGQSLTGLEEFTRDQHDLLLHLPRIAMRTNLSTNVLIVAALHGLATVFAVRYDRPELDRAEALRDAIVSGIRSEEERAEGVNNTLLFMAKIKHWLANIDNELRVATYRFLSEFGRSGFGVRAILSCPGLVETLLDRRLEHDAKVNLWRFAVVQALGENPSLNEAGIAIANLVSQIHQHVHEGPYHKGMSTDVAVL